METPGSVAGRRFEPRVAPHPHFIKPASGRSMKINAPLYSLNAGEVSKIALAGSTSPSSAWRRSANSIGCLMWSGR